MMQQWASCKQAAGDAVLLFRMGDFYEAFYEDARILSEELELTLTKRQEIPMSGVPWHTCETYIEKLVAKGYKVAIAEQTEDPKEAKGLVRREIVRFVTPGTVVGGALLEEKAHNFIASLTQVGSVFGLAVCDITTASFRVIEFDTLHEVQNELYRLNPAELICTKKFQSKHPSLFQEFPVSLSHLEEWRYEHKTASRSLTDHFKVPHLDGFGLKGMVAAINAAGALLAYLHEDLSLNTSHIRSIKPYSTEEILLLDRTCQKNLELKQLLEVIDRTTTPMGGRLLKEWLYHPLLDVTTICKRQDAIEILSSQREVRKEIKNELKRVRDLERLMMRISTNFATPRDVVALADSLLAIPSLKAKVRLLSSELLFGCSELLQEMNTLTSLLKSALTDEPPVRLTDGKVFREGYHPPLDELKEITRGGKEWLARYQNEVKETTGIKNLKVSYNKIFGYYIEVSKGQAHLMPPTFDRRQTLVNSERFISPILKEYESKVLTAEERIGALEMELFENLKEQVRVHEATIFATAEALAQIDALVSLAHLADEERYCRPRVDESKQLKIREGRHPVVEKFVGKETFIPNDILLDGTSEQFMLITGPNMAGKSTYIRQIALLVILAQMGSFIPAAEAHIGIVDRIFTRIGASDDLTRGQSTFMVEMSETATILNNLSPRSLVILDEIGRGTSTYDGVSIAWAVAEHLLKSEAKTLFATHYWELTELEKTHPAAVNYHAAVQEWNDQIIFLHKIAKGGADRSYGIHVARLAGLPIPVLQRATSILKRLEARKEQTKRKKESQETQLTLF